MGRPKKEVEIENEIEEEAPKKAVSSKDPIVKLSEKFNIEDVVNATNRIITINKLDIDPCMSPRMKEPEIFSIINSCIVYMKAKGTPLLPGCGWKGIMATMNSIIEAHNEKL